MEEIIVRKGPNNSLHPATEEDAGKISRYKLGAAVKLRSTKMTEHNYKFHQKLIMLFKLCYDHFVERTAKGLEYRGQLVKPSFDTFREELTILAGHYQAVYSLNGKFRVVADSLRYEICSDEKKEKIFSDVINAALKHVYDGSLEEAALRALVEQILEFDR